MGKKGLGRGLSALIPTMPEERSVIAEEIPIAEIEPNPDQPRRNFNQQSFDEMVESVKRFGVLQPIVVQSRGIGYQIVAGERRWRAAKVAGLKTIPAIIKRPEGAESLEMALVENLHRENLNALEEAEAYQKIIKKFGLTQEELAKKIGKSRPAVANTLRLLELPDAVKQLIVDGNLSAGHAKALLSLSDEKSQISLAERILAEGLTVREAESLARLMNLPKKRKRVPQPKGFKQLAKELSKILNARVKIKMTSKRGKLEISFKTVEELEKLYNKLKQVSSES